MRPARAEPSVLDRPQLTRPSLLTLGRPDLVEPHILRSLSNVRVASIYSSSIAASFVAIDTAGGAWLFGRNEASNLGITSTGSGGTAEGFIPETQPRYLTPHRLGHERADAKFVFAILGRSHTVLVDEDGAVYGAGDNRHGQLGLSPKAKLGVSGFTRIDSCRHLRVKSGSAGASFTVLLTKEGKLFAVRLRELLAGCARQARR